MSIPIRQCLIFKAVGDRDAYKALVDAMVINSKHGAYSIWPCKCDPPCVRPNETQLELMCEQLDRDVKALK